MEPAAGAGSTAGRGARRRSALETAAAATAGFHQADSTDHQATAAAERRLPSPRSSGSAEGRDVVPRGERLGELPEVTTDLLDSGGVVDAALELDPSAVRERFEAAGWDVLL
jgi:hypothetical protein